jgi:predicted HAD superfamily phosphohydrolase
MANFICFDLEGPLSPQDNAYELMKLFPNGDKIFEVISRYDDLLTLEEREDYELNRRRRKAHLLAAVQQLEGLLHQHQLRAVRLLYHPETGHLRP